MRNSLVPLFLLSLCVSGPAQTQPASGLRITPEKIDFGKQAVGSQAQSVIVSVVNPTTAPIKIQEILASGIDFPSQNGCGNELAAGAQCTVAIAFKPLIAGSREGILQITASDAANSHFVPLTGTGTQ